MPSYNGKLIAAAIVSFAIISAVPSTDVHADDAETRAQDMASPFTNEIYSTPKSLVKKEKFIGSLGLDKLPDDLSKKLPDANFGGVFVRPGHNPGLQDSRCRWVCIRDESGKEWCIRECSNK